jgi:MarR family transcriptional regulator, transcriptional regulator for hemolysin
VPEHRVSLAQRLAATSRAADRALDEALARRGGSRTVWRVLAYLAAQPAATQADIARAMGVTGQTLSHHLHRFEVEELITRERDAEDRRAHLVALTDAGRTLLARCEAAHRWHDDELRSRLDPEDVDELEQLLDRVDRVFGEGGPAGLARRRDRADARRRASARL